MALPWMATFFDFSKLRWSDRVGAGFGTLFLKVATTLGKVASLFSSQIVAIRATMLLNSTPTKSCTLSIGHNDSTFELKLLATAIYRLYRLICRPARETGPPAKLACPQNWPARETGLATCRATAMLPCENQRPITGQPS